MIRINNQGRRLREIEIETLTVKKSSTSIFSQFFSQAAKHWVDSSCCGSRARRGSSRSCRLVVSGKRCRCSGRKKRFTCSSVLNAYALMQKTASENVTRKMETFILWASVNELNRFDFQYSFLPLKQLLCLTNLLYRQTGTKTGLLLWCRSIDV